MTFNLEAKLNAQNNNQTIRLASLILAVVFCLNAFISAYLLYQNSIQNYSKQLLNLTSILAEHTSQTIFSAETALNSIFDKVLIEKIISENAYRNFAKKKNQFFLLKDKTQSNSVIVELPL